MIAHLDKNKVVLGMSGGVDSATAALLLKEQGFDVTAFWFDVLGNNEKGRAGAEETAKQLSIPFIAKDVSSTFSDIVISNFCDCYINGRTPNPCVICNPFIKFKELLSVADEIGAYYIATGHYAKTEQNGETGLWHIKKANNVRKDQSYMLYRLSQDAVSRLLLPLEDFSSKEDIRALARENNLKNADLKDSQEICFLPADQNYIQYIKEKGYLPQEGNFVDKEGHVMARHKGLINYTIGQRKGLGVTFGKPMFVTRLNDTDNLVVLGDDEDLFTDCAISENHCFPYGGANLPSELCGAEVMVKIRYTAKPVLAKLYPMENNKVKTIFFEKQRAVTPGQSIVFYQGERIVGGGFIC